MSFYPYWVAGRTRTPGFINNTHMKKHFYKLARIKNDDLVLSLKTNRPVSLGYRQKRKTQDRRNNVCNT